jgi:uncharacterized protein (UPF0332 family)
MNNTEREELVEYRLAKAFTNIKEVDILVENHLWSTALNRIYYSCYYAVTALMVKNQFNPQTHGGVRKLFGLHFIKTGIIPNELGKFFSDVFDLRQTGDYDDFVEIKEDDVLALLPKAKELIVTIEEIIHRAL